MLLGYIVTFGYIALLLALATLVRAFTRINRELIRKTVHVALCLVWVLLDRFFRGSWQILVIPATLIVGNYLSYRYKIFKAIEREDGHNHPGTVYFSIAVTLMFVFVCLFPQTHTLSVLPVFALTFGDGFASIGAVLAKKRHMLLKNRSVEGVVACFLASFVGMTMGGMLAGLPFYPLRLLALSAAAALLELFGGDYDNFTVTLGVYALAVLLY